MQFAYKCLSTILDAPDTHSHSNPLPLQHTPHPPTHLYMYVWHGITHFRGSVVEIMVNIDQEISINYLPQHHPLVVVPDIHWSSAAGFCTVTNYICHPRQPLHPSRESSFRCLQFQDRNSQGHGLRMLFTQLQRLLTKTTMNIVTSCLPSKWRYKLQSNIWFMIPLLAFSVRATRAKHWRRLLCPPF